MVNLNKHGGTEFPPLMKYLVAFVVALCKKFSTCSLIRSHWFHKPLKNFCWGDVCYQLLEELFLLMLQLHFLYFYPFSPTFAPQLLLMVLLLHLLFLLHFFSSSSLPHVSPPPLPLLMFLLLLLSSRFSSSSFPQVSLNSVLYLSTNDLESSPEM